MNLKNEGYFVGIVQDKANVIQFAYTTPCYNSTIVVDRVCSYNTLKDSLENFDKNINDLKPVYKCTFMYTGNILPEYSSFSRSNYIPSFIESTHQTINRSFDSTY